MLAAALAAFLSGRPTCPLAGLCLVVCLSGWPWLALAGSGSGWLSPAPAALPRWLTSLLVAYSRWLAGWLAGLPAGLLAGLLACWLDELASKSALNVLLT